MKYQFTFVLAILVFSSMSSMVVVASSPEEKIASQPVKISSMYNPTELERMVDAVSQVRNPAHLSPRSYPRSTLSTESIYNRGLMIAPQTTVQNFSFKLDGTGSVTPNINNFVLTGDVSNDYWDGETVIFIREGYVNNSYVTGSQGEIIISNLTYTETDLGSFNYSIYFPGAPPKIQGFPPTRTEKVVATGVITITADVVLSPVSRLPDQNQISPNNSYSYSYSLSLAHGTAFNPATFSVLDEFNHPVTTTALAGVFNETYTNELGNPDPLIDLTSRINSQNVAFTGNQVTVASNSGTQTIQTKINLDFSLVGINSSIEKYVTFTQKTASVTPVYTVVVEYVFSTHYYLKTKEITTVNQASETFYRNGTNMIINGSLTNPVVNQTLLENVEVGISILYTPITGGTLTQIQLTKTGVGGFFTYSINLNNTFFEFVENSLTVSVRLDPNDLLAATQLQNMVTAAKQSSRTIGFRADITNMTVSTITTTDTIFISENQGLGFSGKLSYDNNASRNVGGQTVTISLVGGSSFENITAITASNGQFSLTIPGSTLSGLDANRGTFSIYAWIGDITSANKRYYNPANLTSVIQKFNISSAVTLQVSTNIFGDSFDGSNIWDKLNNTMYERYTNGTANYNITISDQIGRSPLGFILVVRERVYYPNGSTSIDNTYTLTLNKTNIILYLSNFSSVLASVAGLGWDNPFNFKDSRFEYRFSIQDSQGTVVSSATALLERFKIFGPDNEAPTLDMGSVTQQDPNEQPVSVTIGVNITASTKFDNINNVTVYWRYSENNFVDVVGDATFVTAYNVSLTTYNSTTGLFEFTIPFRNSGDNGRWVEYFFIVYDLAGHGLDLNGVTQNPSNYSYPDPNLSLFTSYSINVAKFKLGDSTPPLLNGNPISQSSSFGQNVYVCQNDVCVPLVSFTGEIGDNATVRIEVRGVTDANAIQNVTLYYSYWHYFPGNDTYSEFTNVTVLMTPVGSTYMYNFTKNFFDYNLKLDFEVKVYDSVGNSDSSGNASSFLANPFAFSVDDTTKPVIQGTELPFVNDNTDARVARPGLNQAPPAYEFFSNESLSVVLNVTDFGGLGIRNVTITWQYLNSTGQTVLQGNSTVLYDYGTQTVLFTYNFTGYLINQTIVYQFTITDWGNNKISPNGAYTFTSIEFPVPEPVTSTTTIVSTGTDGNTTLITSVVTLNSTSSTSAPNQPSNNSFWILFGFVSVFLILLFINRFNNIKEYFLRARRESQIKSSMESRIDLIRKYGTDGEYKKAVLEIWKATQTLGAEGLQAPQRFNQTVRDYIDIIERVSSIERDMLETLAFSFEKAKYGQEQVTADDYLDALEALNVAIDTVIALGINTHVDDEDDWSDLDFDDEE